MLTIAKMGAHSASYYDSTVDQGIGPDNYYSEAGSAPAQVWMRSNRVAECARFLGVEQGQSLDGGQVKNWFNHTTAPSGNRLGQRMTDAAIIDAYEHAYSVAQEVGADGRKPELPPMKDRQTMARRVRGYVTTSKGEVYGSSTTSGRATSAERKALATMGRRGGKKAAERWKDRDSDYAQSELEKLEKTHRVNRAKGRSTRSKVEQLVNDYYIQTSRVPSRKEVMTELGLSEATVKRHLRALKKEGLLPS